MLTRESGRGNDSMRESERERESKRESESESESERGSNSMRIVSGCCAVVRGSRGGTTSAHLCD